MDNTPGKLTQSGLLYEGNFPEWRARIDSTFEILDLNQFVSSSTLCTYHDPRSEKALGILKSQIHPALYERIPPRRPNCPCHLWRSLEGLCRPFQLFGLTEETRLQVYRHVFRDTSGLQPLLAVCRQLRMETGPYWMPGHYFHLAFDHNTLLDAVAFADRIRTWATTLGSANLKYLRQVIVHFRSSGPSPSTSSSHCELFLCYSIDQRIWVDCRPSQTTNERAVDAALAILEPQVDSVETDRRMLGFQGQAIVLALTTQAPYWVEAYQEWVRVVIGTKSE